MLKRNGNTCPGPVETHSAFLSQPPRLSSRQLLISAQTSPSPVQPSVHTHDVLPGPAYTHWACNGDNECTRDTLQKAEELQAAETDRLLLEFMPINETFLPMNL